MSSSVARILREMPPSKFSVISRICLKVAETFAPKKA